MKVSIIIPTYKPQSYIWKCLDSIYAQTFPVTEMEIIIIVNGCSQPYVKNIESYFSTKGNLQAKVLQTNVPGVSNARNIGLSVANGEWICFIDDDDWISENYIEELVNYGDNDAHIVEANVLDFDETTNQYYDDYLTSAFKRNYEKSHINIVAARSFLSTACCKAIRRSIIGDMTFDCNFAHGEDSLFMAKLSKNIKNFRTTSSKAVYYRRVRRDSASQKKIPHISLLKERLSLAKAYTKIFFSDPVHYDFTFFLTRFLALIRSYIYSILPTR